MKPQRISPQNPTMKSMMDYLLNHSRVLSGNIAFGATMSNTEEDRNINCWKASGTAPAVADTNFTVTHSMGRVPITIAGQDTDNGGLVYRGTVAWTKTTVTLRSTKANSKYNVILA